MKIIFRLLIFFIIIFLNSLLSKDLQKVSLQLKWFDQFQFAGYYMAKEKGFYKDVGLDVEIKKYLHGIDLVKKVVNKEVNYAIGGSNLIIDKSEGKNINLLYSIFQTSPFVAISKKSSNIKDIKSFENKKLALSNDKLAASIFAMVSSKNIKIDDINMVKTKDKISDLINNKVDIISTYISSSVYSLKQKGIEVDIFNPKDYGFDFYGDILFTSDYERNNHKQRVLDFKKASLKGWKYAFSNLQESVDLVFNKYNTQNKTKQALLYEANELKKLAFYNIQKKDIGKIDRHKIQRIYDAYNFLGYVKNKVDIDKFIFKNDNMLNLTSQEKKHLKNNPIIKVANQENCPPFNYNSDKKVKGYMVDYIELLASKLDIKIKYISGYTQAEFIKMIQTSSLDLLINISKNKQIQKDISFSKEIAFCKNMIYTNVKNQNFNSFKDLEGKTVAIPRGSFIQSFLKENNPNIKQVLVKDFLEALKLLSKGEVDATIGKKEVIDFLLLSHAISNIVPVRNSLDNELLIPIQMGVSKKDQILIDILNKAQNSLTEDEKDQLEKKWFGENTKTKAPGTNILTKKEKEYLENKKVLRVCVRKDWLPIESIENDKYIGISADFLNLISKKLSIPLKIINSKNQLEHIEHLNLGKCDIKPILQNGNDRFVLYKSTKPYINDSIGLVTKIEQPFISDYSILENKKIFIKKGFDKSIGFIKKKYPNIIFQEVENINTALKKVALGEAFAYIGTSLNSSFCIQKNFSTKLKIVNSFKNLELGLGVLNSEPQLLSILNKMMDSLTKIDKQKIFNNWITVTIEKKADFSLAYKLFGVLFIILLILMYKVYLKNRHYKELELQVNMTKKAEKRLEKLNQTLEDKVQEEVRKYKQINQQLIYQSRLAQMGEMISMIAHQWRQPLNSISLTSSNLLFKCMMDDIDKELFEKEIALIDEYSQHLSTTIDDFREFFKEKKEKEKTSIAKILNTTLDIVRTSIENKNIKIVTDLNCNSEFETYANEVKQVVLNLIKNAEDVLLEKKIDEPIITIHSSCTKDCDKRVLTIKDNGGGVPDEIIDKIFDPYFSTKLELDGTGLGLYMSKTIIESHCGGKLSVYNDHEGAIFKVEF